MPGVKFVAPKDEYGDSQYIAQDPDGTVRCPNGFELIKRDENTWECTGGAHEYRMDEGDMIKDKFGKISIRKKGERGDPEPNK